MKQVIFLLIATALLTGCKDEKTSNATTASETTGENKTTKEAPAMAYMPTYSTSFEMGNPAYTAMVVQGSWKDWEINSMENMRSWAADTIVAYHSDNSMVKGVDSLQARWIRSRAKYTSVLDTLNAAFAVYSTDKKENWVLIWAKEISTDKSGKIDTVTLQESWRINKDGKADMLLQHERTTKKK